MMMSIFVTILVLIFYINAIAFVRSSKSFQILTNYAEVEKKAVAYVKWKNTFKSKLVLWRPTDICSSSPEVRLDFCKKALHVDLYGFRFDLDHFQYLPCEQQDFRTKFLFPSTVQPFQIEMFSCPRIIYQNLETNEEEFLPYIYAAGRGKSYNKAFTFVQEQTSNIKYPLQYIKNIKFNELKTKSDWDTLYLQKWLVVNPSLARTPLENLLGLQTNGKKKFKIYEKFLSKFHSMNVCGLRQKYIIFLCHKHLETRLSLRHHQVMHPIEGYVAKCRRRPIRIQNGLNLNNMVSVQLCPPNITNDRTLFTTVDTNLYYISSNTHKYSTTLFKRSNNIKGEKLQHLSSRNYQIEMSIIGRHIQLDRFLPYPSEKERMNRARQKTIDNILNEMATVQMTPNYQSQISVKRFYHQLNKKIQLSDPMFIKVFQAPWLVEDILISFSKIKKITQVYTRFVATYRSVDLSKVSNNGRLKMCSQISALIDSKYHLAQNLFGRFVIGSYHSRRVTFTVREIENLETDIFSMWECRSMTDSDKYKYFVGKTHLNNLAVLYRSSYIKNTVVGNNVYPHGIITNINIKGILLP